jgi:MFS transporter, DHA2 family, multidrug resistance protein
MRNLGGAIGLALIDTVIYGRAEMHGRALAARLLSGDTAAFKFVGLPLPEATTKISPFMMELARPAVEKAAFTMSIAEAWAMLAVLTTFGVVLSLAVRRR